jgi:hypothetical protein
MPLPLAYARILDTIQFNQIQGIDPQARVAMIALLEHAGFDDPSNVYETPSAELSVVKLRSLFSSDAEKILLAAVEANDGQLNKVSTFLRKVSSGACARFLVDHDFNNVDHLRHFAAGSAAVHSFSDDFIPYTFDASLANKLKLTDAPSFRKAVAYLRSNFFQLAYLLDPLPLDTYSKIGKKKDDNIHQFWTLLITASNLSKTFSLGLVERSGHALGAKAREYFLSDADTLIEIQTLNTEFANVKMTSGVAAVIEHLCGLVNSLSELGKRTSNIELYTKLLSLLSDNGGYLQTLCVAFRVTNSPPNEDDTLKEFLTYITNDKDAMVIRVSGSSKNEGNTKIEGNTKVVANSLEAKKLKKKEKKVINRKGFAAAMNALGTLPSSGWSSPSAPPKCCINYVARLKIHWNDDTIGMHSDLNKIWNANTNEGVIDYPGFLAQLKREHEQGKNTSPPPPPAPRRNPNVSFANSLQAETFEADIRRCETDDSVKTESSVQVNNVEADEFAAQVFSDDSVDDEISAM